MGRQSGHAHSFREADAGRSNEAYGRRNCTHREWVESPLLETATAAVSLMSAQRRGGALSTRWQPVVHSRTHVEIPVIVVRHSAVAHQRWKDAQRPWRNS